jgi:uncharacterized protein DUF4279
MSAAKSSGTSLMKSERGARRAYASLRIRGDSLDPDHVTRTLRVFPTIAYGKGMKYYAGERTGELVGRTGVWLLSTKDIVASENLYHHLMYIMAILAPNPKEFAPLTYLHAMLAKQKDLHADVACFWHGRFGERRPSIPRAISEFLKIIPAELEVDFETDNEKAAQHTA